MEDLDSSMYRMLSFPSKRLGEVQWPAVNHWKTCGSGSALTYPGRFTSKGTRFKAGTTGPTMGLGFRV